MIKLSVDQLLGRKRQVLVDGKERPLCVVVDPGMISKDGRYIQLGQFYSDEVHGWYLVSELADSVVSVLKEWANE